MSRGRRPDYQGGGTIIRPRDPAWYSDTDKKKKPKTVVIESERAKRRRAEREERELAKNVDALPPGMKSAYLIGTGGRGPKKLTKNEKKLKPVSAVTMTRGERESYMEWFKRTQRSQWRLV